MRVEPELTQNLKFRRLKLAVGDIAMEVLIILWAHCQQNQRGEWWPLADADYVEMLCNWTGQRGELYQALVDCGRPKVGFIVPEDGGLRIHQWEEMNSQTVANWRRNPQGRGVKPTNPRGNPTRTQRLPQRLPTGEPNGYPMASGEMVENSVGQKAETGPLAGTTTGSNDLEAGTQREPNGYPNGYPNANPTRTQCTIIPSLSLSSCLEAVQGRLDLLNQLTGAAFNPPLLDREEIAARLLEVNGDVAGTDQMLRRQCQLWKNDPRARQWLKPSTLFGPKFHEYYGQRRLPVTPPAGSGNKKGAPSADRTELLETLAATRMALEQNPDDPALLRRVEELEAATA